jgi:hypothetical protein
MKLIFIHGRAQEDFEAEDLKEQWSNALIKGLQKSGLLLPANTIIEFPYYGKLLKDLTDEWSKPQNKEAFVTRSGIPTIKESVKNEFFEAFLVEIAENIELTRDEQRELADITAKKRGYKDWEITHKILSFLDRKKVVGDGLLQKHTMDVFLYLTAPQVKKRINEEVLKHFNSEPCVVIGHSLGSIVSYLVLKNNPKFHVKKLITVGSPLGILSIRNYLEQPLEMPKCVQNGWFNAYDDRDIVALNPLDKKHFNIVPSIENKKNARNDTEDHHGIKGYLEDKEVAFEVYKALIS